jgi:hypothetical protein
MKRIILLISAVMMLNNANAAGQENKNVSVADTQKVVSDEKSGTVVTLGDEKIKVITDEDNTTVRLGNRKISVYDIDGDPVVRVYRSNDDWEDEIIIGSEDDKRGRSSRSKRFRAHWAGIEIGLNNYLSGDYKFTLPPEDNFMDINSGISYNFNINFAQLGLRLSSNSGIVAGLGLEFNNYYFDGNNNIMKDENGVIVEYDAGADGITLKKSKFSSTYFTAPLLLEFQIPVRGHKTVNIAGGVIGGAKLCSSTKMVYYVSNDKQKIKGKNDYSMNYLRWGPTARIGYEHFQLYGTLYLTGLFQKDRGPELYPLQVGMAFTFN